MPLTLYFSKYSSPCRGVLLVANDLGVDMKREYVNLKARKEHLTPHFLKMNPQHTIPTLDDNGFYLAESRAIMCYLANKYCKDRSLYPDDPQQRAIIDSRLYFDIGTLHKKYLEAFLPVYLGNATEMKPEPVESLKEAVKILNSFLELTPWVAGNHKTIADHALAVSTGNIILCKAFDMSEFPAVLRWYENCKSSMKGFKEDNLDVMEIVRKMLEERKNEK